MEVSAAKHLEPASKQLHFADDTLRFERVSVLLGHTLLSTVYDHFNSVRVLVQQSTNS